MSETKSYRSYYETEIELARLRKDSATEFELFAALADADEKQGDFTAAVENYEKALDIAVTLENEKNIVFALGRLGFAYFTLGRRERSGEAYDKIRRIIAGETVFEKKEAAEPKLADAKSAKSAKDAKGAKGTHHRGETTATLPDTIPATFNFIGNEKYLETLHTLYAKGIRLFNLYGAGGVGKTSLAVRFAGEIAASFKAKIFIEIPAGEKKYSWRDAMTDIVRKFEFQIFADIPDEKLVIAFTKFVEAQNTLIVLDNAEQKDSVEPLLAAAACFIVTSREPLALPDGESLEILKMSPDDAQHLFSVVAGGDFSAGELNEWAEIADYKPMALKLLASNPAVDLPEATASIKKFRDEKAASPERESPHENTAVEAALEITYRNLSGELQKSLRCLSVFPADFDEPAMRSILRIKAGWTYETRKQLAEYGLLEINAETSRLSMHNLVRSFADMKLSGDERFETYFSFSEYYASILIDADKMQTERDENYYSAILRILDSEWHNIAAGQKWAADFIEANKRAAELCIDYAGYARNFVTLRLSPQQDIEWLECGLKAARLLNDRTFEGSVLGSLGNAYDRLGKYEKAIDYHEQSLEIKRETGNRLGEGLSYGNLGLTYDRLGDYDKAIKYHNQALNIAREIGDRYGESVSLGNLGFTYHSLGEPLKAIEYDEEYLKISREIGNRYGEGASLGNLGIAYGALREYEKAIDYFEKALVIAGEIGNLAGESSSLSNLGAVYEMQGKYDEAKKYHTQALKIFRETNNLLGESNCLGNLGNVYDSLEDYHEAIKHYNQALEIARKIGYRYGEGAVLGILGNVYKTLGETEKACEFWRAALNILKDIKSSDAKDYQQKLDEFCGQ